MKVCYIGGKSYAGETYKKKKTNMSEKLEFKDKVVLVEGEWNMINFTSDLIKAMVDEVLAMKPEDQKNRLELYNDHWESIKSWIGYAENLRWDEKEKAAKADLTIIDEPTIKKLKFQIEEQKRNDWGISPSLKLERDINGTLTKILLRNLALVVDPAQGKEAALERLKNAEGTVTTLKKELERAKLEKPNNKGDKKMEKFNIADLIGKSIEEIKEYGITFLGKVNDELKKIKKDIAGKDTPIAADLQRNLSDLKTQTESLKTKIAVEDQPGFDQALDEIGIISNLIQKLNKVAPKLELLPVMRLNFEGDGQFQSIGAKRYKKELIRESSYLDPRDMTSTLKVTSERIDGWISNFKRGLKRVPIPLRHTDDPMKNSGWIVDLMKENGSLYGICEFTNPLVEELINNGSIKDVSVGIDPNFIDTKTGQQFGEALEHVALTVVPHITNLAQFEPIAAEYKREVIEMKQSKNQEPNRAKDLVYMELVNSNQTLQKKVASLEKDRDNNLQEVVTNRVAKLVADGRLTPGLKDRVLAFALAGRKETIELEKNVQKCIGEEFLGILEGLEITFEMVQKSHQTSEIPKNRKYCSPEDFSTGSLKGKGYSKAIEDKKIILEAGSGRAYWVA